MLGIPKAAATSPEKFEALFTFAKHLYLSQEVARELLSQRRNRDASEVVLERSDLRPARFLFLSAGSGPHVHFTCARRSDAFKLAI